MANTYNFNDQLKMSYGILSSGNIDTILLANILGAMTVSRASLAEDKQGTDWWVKCYSGQAISVDCKARSKDYSLQGQDDLALETWSVVEQQKVGWTRDKNKRTDYILWFWNDTKRWCLIPFQMLCATFNEKWRQWCTEYRSARQYTKTDYGGYHSECVFVPRAVVWVEIIQHYGSQPKASEQLPLV